MGCVGGACRVLGLLITAADDLPAWLVNLTMAGVPAEESPLWARPAARGQAFSERGQTVSGHSGHG